MWDTAYGGNDQLNTRDSKQPNVEGQKLLWLLKNYKQQSYPNYDGNYHLLLYVLGKWRSKPTKNSDALSFKLGSNNRIFTESGKLVQMQSKTKHNFKAEEYRVIERCNSKE